MPPDRAGGRSLCVVHLVRAANGPRPLRAFSAAMRRHPPGIDCRLVLAMKGFGSAEQARPLLDELADLAHEAVYFPDVGLDLGTYFAAARRVRADRYCFLNSFSEPLADGWLAKLDAALDEPRVGMVGATGSWASTLSWLTYSLGLPSAYRGSLPAPSMVRQQLGRLVAERAPDGRLSMRERLRLRAMTVRLLPEHERFPSHHLRTNAFMVSQATLADLRLPPVRGQLDTLALESGRRSITRQVQRLGLRTLVVDRAGAVFDHDCWDRSNTLYQAGQEGLLVADNRTRLYERGDLPLRSVLAGLTWASHARPGGPLREREQVDAIM